MGELAHPSGGGNGRTKWGSREGVEKERSRRGVVEERVGGRVMEEEVRRRGVGYGVIECAGLTYNYAPFYAKPAAFISMFSGVAIFVA